MTTSVSLTSDQQIGADAFFDFMMDPIAKTFVLSGGAGVGKTWLMGHICKEVMKTYQDACALIGIKPMVHQLTFAATTNKAAEVLEDALGVPVQTIHSFMGLKVKDNYRTGKQSIEKTERYAKKYNQIIFIDESSMLDSEMYELILETFVDSKIVFVGDHAQMAPVNERLSPVYLDVDPDNFVFLAQPVRNAGSPALVDLCAQLRGTVETGAFHPIDQVRGSVEYLDKVQMPAKLIEVFGNNLNPSARVLCYTNSRVKEYNAFIREIRGKTQELQVGDVMVAASAYAVGKNILNVEREVVITGISPELNDMGYVTETPDGKPIMTRSIEVSSSLTSEGGMPVTVAENPWQVTETLKALAAQKDWAHYFNLKNSIADLRDKAACTVYKSQGSTYDQVFIDIGNIGTSYDSEQVARMLFVAVSRATTKVFLFGDLPGKYIRSQAA